MEITQPELLASRHNLEPFFSSEPSLDTWLKERALSSTATATTYVICADGNVVVGYYCLSSGAMFRASVPGNAKQRQGLPNPLPIILLGRLAITQSFQGHGLGADLLRDALLRAIASSKQVAAYGLVAHALNQSAKSFYQRWGFVEFRDKPMAMLLPLKP